MNFVPAAYLLFNPGVIYLQYINELREIRKLYRQLCFKSA